MADAESHQHSVKRLSTGSLYSTSSETIETLPALEAIPDESSVDDENPPPDPPGEQNLNDDNDSIREEDTKSTITVTDDEDYFINGQEYNSAFPGVLPWTPTHEGYREVLDITDEATYKFFGRRCQAPVLNQAQNVLDVGTGTGIWAMAFADENPQAKVIASDISHIQPEWVPPNLQFELDDCTRSWDREEGAFDFIHARNLAGSIDSSHLFGEAYRCLGPGGYFESHEQSLCPQPQGTPVKPLDSATERDISALERCEKLFRDLGEQKGRSFLPVDVSRQMELMEKAGFTDLKGRQEWMPIGSWAKDHRFKLIGLLLRDAWEKGLDGMLNRPAMELKWSPVKAAILAMQMRTALRSPKLNLVIKVVIIVGRKPVASSYV